VPWQLCGYGRSDWSTKLIRGLTSEAPAGFRSRRGPSHDSTLVTPHNAPFSTYKVPPSGSAGTGAAVVVINPVANIMSVGVNFSGLGSGTTMSHIHCCLSFPFQPNNNVMVATTTPTFPGFPLGVTAGNYAMTFNLLNPATYNPAFITSAFNPSGT